jgi:hypothetical protein
MPVTLQPAGGQYERVIDFLVELSGRTRRLATYGTSGLTPRAALLSIYSCAAMLWSLTGT